MEPNIAVLIDFENIAAGTEKEGLGKCNVGLIMNRLREKGRVLVARSYADWGRFARFKKDMMFESVSLFELSAHGMNDKNRADVALVVDCMELALTRPYIDTYVVVSGDSDFTPLIMKLRELNKRVIGLGTRRSTSRLIVEACDEFIFYDTLRKETTQRTRRRSEGADKPTKSLSREDAMELVTEALAALQREDPKAYHASRIKEQILRKEPAFSDADLGFSSFARFVEYCKKQGLVTLTRDARGGGYLVDSTDGEGSVDEPPVVDLSPGARKLYESLKSEDFEVLSRDMRQSLADTMMQVIEERSSKNKRVNIQWVTQDSTKRIRSVTPELSARRVKSLINVMHSNGVFRHSDGEPVRSFFAAFELGAADAKGLMKLLDVAALRKLDEMGVNLKERVPDLAELLYGSKDQSRQIEELMAWELPRSATESPKSAPKASDPVKADASPPEKKTRRRRSRKSEDAAAAEAVLSAEKEAQTLNKADAKEDEPAEAAPAPKRKRAPRKRPAKTAGAAATETAAPKSEVVAPEAEAKATTQTKTKPAAPKKAAPKKRAPRKTAAAKTTAAKSAESDQSDDATAAPAKKTTTRRRKPAAKKDAAEGEPKAAPKKRTTAARRKTADKNVEEPPAE